VVEVEAAATKRGKGGGGTTETLFFFFNYYYYYYYSLSFPIFFIATLLCKNIKGFSCTYCTIIRTLAGGLVRGQPLTRIARRKVC
jgi:hypothetical protein